MLSSSAEFPFALIVRVGSLLSESLRSMVPVTQSSLCWMTTSCLYLLDGLIQEVVRYISVCIFKAFIEFGNFSLSHIVCLSGTRLSGGGGVIWH